MIIAVDGPAASGKGTIARRVATARIGADRRGSARRGPRERECPTMFIRTMLIDDHEVVRRGLAELLSAEADIEIVASLGSVGEALEADLSSVDVAVVDVRLPDGDGIDLVRRLRSQLPNLHCLVLTAYEDDVGRTWFGRSERLRAVSP